VPPRGLHQLPSARLDLTLSVHWSHRGASDRCSAASRRDASASPRAFSKPIRSFCAKDVPQQPRRPRHNASAIARDATAECRKDCPQFDPHGRLSITKPANWLLIRLQDPTESASKIRPSASIYGLFIRDALGTFGYDIGLAIYQVLVDSCRRIQISVIIRLYCVVI
jgi:hypothetical protein